MRMQTTLFRVFVLQATLASASAFAQTTDVSVNLTEPDGYAYRAVTVTRADSTQIKGVLSIVSYEATTKTFVLDTARQGMVRVPAADISELVFAQSLRQSPPQAQTCPSSVIATPGATAMYRVPAGSLRIDLGRLVLGAADASALSSDGAVLEARRIAYDRKKDVFTVLLQAVRYAWQTLGCGGGSADPSDPGASKGLQ